MNGGSTDEGVPLAYAFPSVLREWAPALLPDWVLCQLLETDPHGVRGWLLLVVSIWRLPRALRGQRFMRRGWGIQSCKTVDQSENPPFQRDQLRVSGVTSDFPVPGIKAGMREEAS